MNDDEEKRKERHAKRLKELNERIDFKKFQRQHQATNDETKHWTKRPQVDKLNPERIYAVGACGIWNTLRSCGSCPLVLLMK